MRRIFNYQIFFTLTMGVVFLMSSCSKMEIDGCTDPFSLNYNAEATRDDGSCIYSNNNSNNNNNNNVSTHVEEKNSTVVLKHTATWCYFCGSWGADAFALRINNQEDDIVPFAVHASGSDKLYTQASASMRTNFPSSGTPNFYANNVSVGTIDSQIPPEVERHKSDVVIANTSIITKITDDEVMATTNTKFFQDAEGEYLLAVFLVESNIPGGPGSGPYAQQGITDPDWTHKYVIRAAFTEDPMGKTLVNGSVSAGTTYTENFSIDLHADWDPEHIRVQTIIFKKVDTKYEIVNAAK